MKTTTPPALLRVRARVFFLATVMLLLLFSLQRATFAGSASWNDTGSDWNTNADWTPNTGFPNGAADTATFNLANTNTSVGVSASTEVAGITFSNLATNPYTITVAPTRVLTISGTGITNNSGITQNFVTTEGSSSAEVRFTNSATAGSMTSITNKGGANGGFGAAGGLTQFFNSSTAGSATITNNGGGGLFATGGETKFNGTSNAGSATLVANGAAFPAAGPGSIQFLGDSTGGMASVDVRNNGAGAAGNLDIRGHNAGSVTIGSLEGSGDVLLGTNNLTVGSNNLSKTFSGFIQENGPGGSLTKIGTGALTLTGANIYSGGTTVNAGSLFVNTPGGVSGTGDGAVAVNGGTLGGNGTISGAVTVSSGATLAPGPTGNGSTGILNTGDLTLASGSIFSVDLEGAVAGTSYDQVFASGAVSIATANLDFNGVSGLSVGEQLFIVESTGAVGGTFAGFNNGTTFTQDGVTFTINYNPSNVELTVDRVAAVPDTGPTFGLLALALAALVGAGRLRSIRLA